MLYSLNLFQFHWKYCGLIMLCELLDTLHVVSMLANILIHYLIASLANQLPVSVHQTGPALMDKHSA